MRLIDADKLIKELIIKTVSKDAHIISIANAVVNLVHNQPTAFDVEKVVAELKELSNAEADYYYANSNDVIDRETAIEIVENGGK